MEPGGGLDADAKSRRYMGWDIGWAWEGKGDIHKELSWGFCSSVENDRVELPPFCRHRIDE